MDFNFDNINITDGFWKHLQKVNENITINAVYDRFFETGRIDALKCNWKEGMDKKPHVYWDSDVAKWVEGAFYILAKKKQIRNWKKESIL